MKTTTLVLAVALVLPLAALAQAPAAAPAPRADAKALKDKEAVTFNEIERGFYIGVGGGGFFLVNPPTLNAGDRTYFSPGMSIEAELGVDLFSRLSVALFLISTFNRMNSDYTAFSGNAASGDFSSITPGLTARVNIVGFDDSQDVRRWWIFARAGGGVSFYSPVALFTQTDGTKRNINALVFGGLGVEYYTRLRHFSLALEADFVLYAMTMTFGFNVMPTLRYAF